EPENAENDQCAEEGTAWIEGRVLQRTQRGSEPELIASRGAHGSEEHQIQSEGHGDQRQQKADYQPARVAARGGLTRIKVHCLTAAPSGHEKLTLGASRASGLAMSIICAGWKPNIPATMLLGKTSRVLL